MATSFTEGAHILDSIHDVQPRAPFWYGSQFEAGSTSVSTCGSLHECRRSFCTRHHFIAPVLNRLRVRFHPVLPIPRHGYGGVQLSPFLALGAASAFTPQDRHRRGLYVSFEIRQVHLFSLASALSWRALVAHCVHTGYNFVGSSRVEVPVANLSHALGFFFVCLLSVHVLFPVCRLRPRCRVGRQLLSRHAVLQLLVLYASDTSPSCCSSH